MITLSARSSDRCPRFNVDSFTSRCKNGAGIVRSQDQFKSIRSSKRSESESSESDEKVFSNRVVVVSGFAYRSIRPLFALQAFSSD